MKREEEEADLRREIELYRCEIAGIENHIIQLQMELDSLQRRKGELLEEEKDLIKEEMADE